MLVAMEAAAAAAEVVIQRNVAARTSSTVVTADNDRHLPQHSQNYGHYRKVRESYYKLAASCGICPVSVRLSVPSFPHVITGNLNVTANTFKKKLKTFYYTNRYP